MNITTVVGTRPNYIKLSVLLTKLQKHHDITVINTGQHYDYQMSDVFFQQLTMPNPDYNLGISGGSNDEQIELQTQAIKEIISSEPPKLMVVFGDTNSSLSGALAAHNLGIPIAHVEAGVRSFDIRMQEEKNRIQIDKLSSLLFAPSELAVKHLHSEKVTEGIWQTGDILIDTLNEFKQIAKSHKIDYKDYNILTLHRAENVDNKEILSNILKGIRQSGISTILPIHPRTKKNIDEFGITLPENIIPIEPLGYLDMINLMYKSNKIITDSGGIQKEAYTLSKPCITLRGSTEWNETLLGGWNVLVDAEKMPSDFIADTIVNHEPWSNDRPWFYGNGHASYYISRIITEWDY